MKPSSLTTLPVVKAAKILFSVLLMLALLVVGAIAAQVLWEATHHRYDNPDSGYYHGVVNARFSGMNEDVYSFNFRGKSVPGWHWTYFTNFQYDTLQFEWHRFSARGDGEERGTIRLPSLVYESPHGNGVLTRAILAQWLIGTTNGEPAALKGIDSIFGFITAAGQGRLPHPNHHGHYIEEPVWGHIQHFQSGFGVGSFVYVWVAAWFVWVVRIALRFRSKSAQHSTQHR